MSRWQQKTNAKRGVWWVSGRVNGCLRPILGRAVVVLYETAKSKRNRAHRPTTIWRTLSPNLPPSWNRARSMAAQGVQAKRTVLLPIPPEYVLRGRCPSYATAGHQIFASCKSCVAQEALLKKKHSLRNTISHHHLLVGSRLDGRPESILDPHRNLSGDVYQNLRGYLRVRGGTRTITTSASSSLAAVDAVGAQ